jgi:putative hydrolase of the HAD superfamily
MSQFNHPITQSPDHSIPPRARTRAVFFDVDFTLIHPGPMFLGEGYRAFCERYGIQVDAAKFAAAVSAAAPLLDDRGDSPYDAEIFVAYTRRIIEEMGGEGPQLDACAREIYDEWAGCHHFQLFDDVPEVLRGLAADGIRIGLISNSHRCLDSFQSHFELRDVVSAAVSSPEQGYMKPHPRIFARALELVAVEPHEAVMVGDSVCHDVEGALRAGWRAVLLHRTEGPAPPRASELGVPVVRSLRELPSLL